MISKLFKKNKLEIATAESTSDNTVIEEKLQDAPKKRASKAKTQTFVPKKPKVIKTVVSTGKPRPQNSTIPSSPPQNKTSPEVKKPKEEQIKKAKTTEALPSAEKAKKNEAIVEVLSAPPAPQKASGSFEIKKTKDNRFVFNLFASNHVIIATSQIYSSSTSAVNGINSVIANSEKADIEDKTLKTVEEKSFPKWEIHQDKAGQFRFRLYASNGSCICHSQGYTSKTNCKKGIESIIRSVTNASIDKAYLQKDK